MESTGAVRRIDGLGRIVIPKEIRSSLKLKEGSPLEMYLERDTIILKKHSITDMLKNVAHIYTESVYDTTNSIVVITNKEKIVSISGLKKDYEDQPISNFLEDCIKNRYVIVENKKMKFALSKNEKETEYCYAIQPIEVTGEVIGLVVLLNKSQITELEEKTTKMVAQILGKYIEE